MVLQFKKQRRYFVLKITTNSNPAFVLTKGGVAITEKKDDQKV
jgi:hypothetical protein